MPFILIVEDDITFSLMLTTWLRKKGFHVETSSTVREAKQYIEKSTFDIIVSDLRLPDGNGLELLSWLKSRSADIPVIMMTSYAEIQTAVQAIKSGASDYIAKPLNPEELLLKINEVIQVPSGASAVKTVKTSQKHYLEGHSPAAVQLFQHVNLVSPTDMSVLITGASGTGKEYVARKMHENSRRSNFPFIAIDCGALPRELAASEFFGHIKGAFTGAINNKTGAFEAAKGGTVFLDEIGNLTYEIQIQLLRALQERKIRAIGSNKEVDIDIRLISATNENLRKAIEKGEFREDLYHRLNEFTIHIPDLKDRKEDILLFANHFLDQANSELHKNITGFDEQTETLFGHYHWPGNLRQMKNVVRYATLLSPGPYITLNELPAELKEEPPMYVHRISHLKDETHEKQLIINALEEAGNNKTKAARLLGIDRKTLYNKLKLYNLE